MASVSVSIILPVWNAEAHVGEAVQSIVSQHFLDWELLVLDDASTDGTLAVVEGFADPRIRLIRHADKRGLAKLLNEGISLAVFPYSLNTPSA